MPVMPPLPKPSRVRELDLLDKVAVISGASRGIGRAIAFNLASRGCSILGTCTSDIGVKNISSIFDDEVSSHIFDATSRVRPASLRVKGLVADIFSSTCARTIADEINNTFNGRLDIFINCASDPNPGIIGEMDTDEVQRSLLGNIQTPVMIVEEFVRRRYFKPNSRIIYISSIRSRQPWSEQLMYGAGKSAGESLCRTWAQAFGGKEERYSFMAGTTANAVTVGLTETEAVVNCGSEAVQQFQDEFFPSQSIPRFGQPDDVADVVGLLCGSDARWITGCVVEEVLEQTSTDFAGNLILFSLAQLIKISKRPLKVLLISSAIVQAQVAYKRRNGPAREDLSSDEAAPASEGHILQDALGLSPPVATANQTSTKVSQIARQIVFTPGQAEYLLESYFDILQDANPVFSKELFFHRYRSSQCSEDLISTILIITAKLTGFTANEDDPISLDTRLDQILSSSILEDDLIGDLLSLDQFRKAFILAFYEFHQFPGHQAWLRVGRVTRMAYRIGLDRLDHIRTLYPDWNTVSPEDIQEWKSLWWCLYRLDTYSNISSGTPYLVDDNVIRTSLIQSYTVQPSGTINTSSELFLPPNSEDLSKILLAASSSPETLLRNVHNITTAILRHAGLIFRLNLPHSQEVIGAQVAKVERQLATIRLALPPGWLNPRRNAFSNESHADHHARTITVLHLRMAQLLLSIADTGLRQGDEWLLSWQNVLETCQDIASIADQWDSSFCLAVDPAISFTIFTAMIFLDLHKKATIMAEHNHSSDIDHHITILRLQLQHFARIWTLPRLLKLSFESFSQSVSGPLSHRHIALILSRFEAPLHPRWLQFLSSANTALADCK
ncbi:hypothetical protein PEBR_14516 [Penicillium brasilianum]|uniref:Xylanolytic transcriptional activator regulatory domain-containing protein n=1 Tax=Penicillium brasilianum TaxID=104259 RepID=A0A1S9RSK7_PENBI|nr:hypothetical protein PEBR_14516 [Penicillium brasilianum]